MANKKSESPIGVHCAISSVDPTTDLMLGGDKFDMTNIESLRHHIEKSVQADALRLASAIKLILVSEWDDDKQKIGLCKKLFRLLRHIMITIHEGGYVSARSIRSLCDEIRRQSICSRLRDKQVSVWELYLLAAEKVGFWLGNTRKAEDLDKEELDRYDALSGSMSFWVVTKDYSSPGDYDYCEKLPKTRVFDIPNDLQEKFEACLLSYEATSSEPLVYRKYDLVKDDGSTGLFVHLDNEDLTKVSKLSKKQKKAVIRDMDNCLRRIAPHCYDSEHIHAIPFSLWLSRALRCAINEHGEVTSWLHALTALRSGIFASVCTFHCDNDEFRDDEADVSSIPCIRELYNSLPRE